MNESALLLELDFRGIMKQGGVVVLGGLLWLILVLVSSMFLKKGKAARGLLNQLRFFFFPALIYFIVVRYFFELAEDSTPYRVAQTALAAAGVILALGILNLIFNPTSLRRWIGREVPSLLLDVARYVLIIIGVAVILKVVWKEDVTPLIGALGIGGIVLGLALQEPLGNFFNGLALLAERPFGLGDWIRIGEGHEGQVEHITWRAVKMRTNDNEYIIVPNSVISKEKLVNFNLPTRVQALKVTVGTSYDDPPDVVKAVIREVLAGVHGVLAEPKPAIYTTGYADFSINYEIKFFVDDYGQRNPIKDRVMSRLWYAFKRRGIEIPFPIRHLYHHGTPPAAVEAADAPLWGAETASARGAIDGPRRKVDIEGALAAVPLFSALSPAEIQALSAKVRVLEFGDGERVIRQGEAGDGMYTIAGGEARVLIRGDNGAEREVAVLREGNVFGEMSLLTGDPRTASIDAQGHLAVVEVGKDALSPVLSSNPALAAGMAEIVVLRREMLDRARAMADSEKEKEIAAASKTLLGRIRSFFGLGG
jgi:small-conductance mechanosensitive channel/CRP-like cAMP-binding protein